VTSSSLDGIKVAMASGSGSLSGPSTRKLNGSSQPPATRREPELTLLLVMDKSDSDPSGCPGTGSSARVVGG
jgi:hypothetical protein